MYLFRIGNVDKIQLNNIEEAAEDGSNVVLMKLVLSSVEGTGKRCECFPAISGFC